MRSLCSVSTELPVQPGSVNSGGGSGSGSEPPVSALLEQCADLWERDDCSAAPLHLLFTPLTVTAVLKAGDTEVCLTNVSQCQS